MTAAASTRVVFGPCPPWCPESHEQAIDEGCSMEDARVHLGDDIGYHLSDIVNDVANRLDRPGGTGWRMLLRADPGPQTTWYGYTTVFFEVHERDEAGHYRHLGLPLTSGEARIMARQLTHFADALDLPS